VNHLDELRAADRVQHQAERPGGALFERDHGLVRAELPGVVPSFRPADLCGSARPRGGGELQRELAHSPGRPGDQNIAAEDRPAGPQRARRGQLGDGKRGRGRRASSPGSGDSAGVHSSDNRTCPKTGRIVMLSHALIKISRLEDLCQKSGSVVFVSAPLAHGGDVTPSS
jgi:hypothetical protein